MLVSVIFMENIAEHIIRDSTVLNRYEVDEQCRILYIDEIGRRFDPHATCKCAKGYTGKIKLDVRTVQHQEKIFQRHGYAGYLRFRIVS